MLHFPEDLIQALAMNVLHSIEMHSVLLAHAEDRYDVGMMQPCRCLGLALEAFQQRWLQQPGEWEHFEGHVPAKRLLNRLVHDSHAALPNLAQDAIAAQPLRNGRGTRTRAFQLRTGLLQG